MSGYMNQEVGIAPNFVDLVDAISYKWAVKIASEALRLYFGPQVT